VRRPDAHPHGLVQVLRSYWRLILTGGPIGGAANSPLYVSGMLSDTPRSKAVSHV